MINFPASEDTVLTIAHLKPEYQEHAIEGMKYIKTDHSKNVSSERQDIQGLKAGDITDMLDKLGIK